MKNNLFLGMAALAASTIFIAPTVARADDLARDQVTAQVSYADLDLAAAKDQARLQTRIAAKVRRLCDDGSRDLRSRVLQAECREEGMKQVDREVRLAVANQQRGKARRA